jgi:hypothetical protein
MLRSRSLTPIAILAAICASGAGASDFEPLSGGLIGSWQGGSGAAYLGKLSSNRYDPESISNPYGRYGSPYGNTLANPFSKYGSPYSSESWRNPYTMSAPRIFSFSR